MIKVTENAVKHLRELLEERDYSPAEKGLRLFVSKGGCAGYSYSMKIAEPTDSDEIVESGGVRVFVDRESLPYLRGCEVDYEDSLNDSGFKIHNPNAARSCGCGTSFEPAKAGQEPSYDPEMDGTACAEPEVSERL